MVCDQPSAPACAEHWHCDPVSAASASTTPIMGAAETDEPVRAAQRGCARTRCDQSGGFICLTGWECAPDRATEDTGCAAIPCDRLGHCSSDTVFICDPTSSGPRPDTKDAFGCVPRNCEEGYACTFNYNGENFAYCDASSPDTDSYGCRVHTCVEMPSACASGSYRCDPGAPTANRLGCVPVSCTEGYVCADGWTCDPSGTGHNVFGCVPDVSATGGAGGGAGSGGSGAGVAGTTGGTGAVGGTNASGGAAGSAGLNGGGGSIATGGSGAVGGTSGTAGTGGHVTGMCVDE
jgi:hypothetical protein